MKKLNSFFVGEKKNTFFEIMKTIEIDIIESSELPDPIYLDLLNLSTFKSDEFGFSFMVNKTYIEIWICDLKDDNQLQGTIGYLEKLVSNMKSDYLFINCD